ncbi:ENHANCED RESPONSE TO ABA3, CYTOKININ RESISTANT 1, ORESARA 2, ETHYLENE INSENSITIVE 2, ORESARA 3 [Hibiscus trionum]|uniref:ENHANCED RESPONSE TO ABA3, CYTOKININ RESISTANT 1, ORESARA 2, ETHYLENE INSENSITIVE 2, ORESARA 3 n=1 Tax=Hibiscus trionum TaxID=183268 RepID=A0A9W7HL05_HIBTR|nr:ENHANCED RESPONSE TO ABA3, CYTOKININ RESISTANT 1, ORESARA 2, ETHYLENE INSENSITIVE 2, ORESARA 3 [Hibiscus trionum]
MEAEAGIANHQPGVIHRLLPAVLPVLLISIGYVDPGKWAVTVEGGARFGLDLVVPMLLFNLAAILCQYLSARIGVVTGRDLAQICCDEYEKSTRIFLGVQAELSMIILDLTMVLGVAHGINLLFGVDLSTCVFLAALDAVLFPVFASLLDHCRASFLCMYVAGFILLSYVFGVLISQPESSLSMTGMLTRLSGESAFALMSLLGASIMPHNFYLHSSIVQQHQRRLNISMSTVCHDHFFAIVCVFSGLCVVNYVLMNAASNVFYNAGLVLVTFQDAMSLLEQAFGNGVLSVVFMLVMFLSNQITASTWNLGGQVVLHDFLGLHIPGWLHCATIRNIASVPALYCVWTSGAEGIFQLLILTQVMIALLLPSSVIPLFRIASSRQIMGVYKIPPIMEFLALVTFMGMLGLKIIFVVEMIFGNSDWVGNLRSDAGIGMSFSLVVLLVTAGASFSLMLWLAATPLKSASSRNEAHALNWDLDRTVPEVATEREENDLSETRYHGDESARIEERSSMPENSIESHFELSSPNYDLNLPETILESGQEILLNTINENTSNNICPGPSVYSTQESVSVTESASAVVDKAVDDDLPGTKTSIIEEMNSMERTVSLEGNLRIEKDDDLGDALEPKEPSKPPSGSISSLTLDGPPSFRSLSGKNDDGGSGTGSLSRLAGLGRAARRQLAAILDEFWGQLYDFHGQHTLEAKKKKLDVLLGVDSKQLKVDTTGKEHGGYFPLVGGRASDALINSSPYDSPKQQLQGQNSIDSSYGYSRGSSMWSNHMQFLDAYVQNSSRNVDSSERRYSSLRTATPADAWDYQPATVHGYQIKSYLNRIAKDRSSDGSNSQMDLQAVNSPALGPTNYRDSMAFTLEQKLQNGITPTQESGFQNVAASRNSLLQSEISYNDIFSPGINDNSGTSVNSKKYHSLPSISGLSVPRRDLYRSDKSAPWDSSVGYGSSAGRTNYETSMYGNAGSRVGVPSAFDELSRSKGYRDALPLPLSSTAGSGSLWCRQPFEQFGVAEIKRTAGGEALGSGLNSTTRDTAFGVDLESKLLLSFRHCIVKLLKLDGSDWLFRQNDGADEDLIDRVAARERFLYDAEARQINQTVNVGEPQYLSSERRYCSTPKSDEANLPDVLISSVPNCGEGCIWKADLIISFGVWCIHRILDLSLMESRPELWGKYTFVLNRLQGVIELAFSKPRSPMSPCFCLQIPADYQQRSSPPVSNGVLPPTAKPGRGKCTNATVLLDIIKDVEIAISCRKGRSGTAAGDVAFPKGKENLTSVLKRYKRRLSNLVGAHEGSGSRKVPMSASYGS